MTGQVLDQLRRVDLFAGLSDDELLQITRVCQVIRVGSGETLFNEGDEGQEMYLIFKGSVRVMINARRPDGTVSPSTINMLYSGQSFGEMILLNSGTRSATVVSAEPTTLIVIREADFGALCESSPRIGYLVIRNLAQDLAYKLRSSNLLLRGNIRWKEDELAN
ncbi:MAG: cyclic nucleotide-binding domain-containing protein [Blastochloris sp.]|nr:cyclic nucleotide-binding domain-containing protein [Blastochloris sp.]